MNIETFAVSYLDELMEIKNKLDIKTFTKITEILFDAYNNGKKIFVFGNGGSASTASHFACDLNKCACENSEKKFKVISLADNIPTMLAIANDINYESIFSYQLANFFEKGDLAVGISGSGNSENVIKGINFCNEHGGTTIGISGFGGGRLAETAQIPMIIPSSDMQKTEDYHMILVHIFMRALKNIIENK